MRAAWWWIDRWRLSEAYATLTLAEQGAYRNLLDELWLREGPLPDDDRVLGRACGDPVAWPGLRAAVMAQFTLTPGGWVHPTQTDVMEDSKRRHVAHVENGRRGAASRWNGRANGEANGMASSLAIGGANGEQHGEPIASVSGSGSVSDHRAKDQKETKPCRRQPTTGGGLPPFAVLWNEKVAGTPLKTIRVWTAKRDRVVKARLAEEGDLGLWGLAMEHLSASPHHRGENDRGWVADVDFLLQEGQYAKWLDLAHGGPPVKADPEITPQLRRLMGGA